MFKFEHPVFLYYGLGLVVLLILLEFLIKQKRLKAIGKLAWKSLWSNLIPGFDPNKLAWRSRLWLSGMTLLILAMSNPQWGIRKEKVEIKSTDIYIAMDISNSMLCEDIKPNRLERAKLWAESLIKNLASDRVGTILFAGHAFLQSPLTTDYGSATMFIRSAHPELISTQGTNLEKAISTALENFSNEKDVQRVLFILSDGEDNATAEENAPQAIAAAEKAKEKNVAIFTVGTGTTAGGLIPVFTPNNMEEYKRDETGKPVVTKLNMGTLQNLSRLTNGKYYSIQDGDAVLSDIKSELANMQKQRIAERTYSEFESYFQYLLVPGLSGLLLMRAVVDRPCSDLLVAPDFVFVVAAAAVVLEVVFLQAPDFFLCRDPWDLF